MSLRIDGTRVAKTREQVLARIAKAPSFEVVSEEALATIENVIQANHDEAWDRWPQDQWYRIQFWKDAVLDAVPEELKGVFAGYFHEYVASNLRGSVAMTDDADRAPRTINPGIEAQVRRDAYLATSASLDDSTWRSVSYRG